MLMPRLQIVTISLTQPNGCRSDRRTIKLRARFEIARACFRCRMFLCSMAVVSWQHLFAAGSSNKPFTRKSNEKLFVCVETLPIATSKNRSAKQYPLPK